MYLPTMQPIEANIKFYGFPVSLTEVPNVPSSSQSSHAAAFSSSSSSAAATTTTSEQSQPQEPNPSPVSSSSQNQQQQLLPQPSTPTSGNSASTITSVQQLASVPDSAYLVYVVSLSELITSASYRTETFALFMEFLKATPKRDVSIVFTKLDVFYKLLRLYPHCLKEAFPQMFSQQTQTNSSSNSNSTPLTYANTDLKLYDYRDVCRLIRTQFLQCTADYPRSVTCFFVHGFNRRASMQMAEALLLNKGTTAIYPFFRESTPCDFFVWKRMESEDACFASSKFLPSRYDVKIETWHKGVQ